MVAQTKKLTQATAANLNELIDHAVELMGYLEEISANLKAELKAEHVENLKRGE